MGRNMQALQNTLGERKAVPGGNLNEEKKKKRNIAATLLEGSQNKKNVTGRLKSSN